LRKTLKTIRAVNMECFTIYADEIKNRIDPHFYRPAFIQFYQQLEKTKFEIKTIGEITEKVTSGATPKSKGSAYTTQEEGIPFVRSGDINEDKNINFDEVLYIKDNIHNKLLKGSKLKKGDVLIAIVGATIGQVSIYDYDKEANINQAIALLRLKQEINPEYVKAFMISTLGQKQLDRIKRPVARANINLDEIRSIKIILPSLAMQIKIVDLMDNAYKEQKNKESKINKFLDSINDYVLDELGIKLPELKDKMAYVVNSDEIEGRIDPQYYNPKISIIKKELHKCGKHLFGEVIEEIYRYPTFYGIEYLDNGIKVIKGESINKYGIINEDKEFDYIDESTHNKYSQTHVKKGDLVFTVRGIIGKVGCYELDDEANINANVIKIRLKEDCNSRFFWIYLNSKIGQSLVGNLSSGQVQKTITVPDIKNIPIPLPPLAVQNKIAEEVKKRIHKAEQLQKEAKEELEKAKQEVEKIILGEDES
jgi:restriction endonuclease S subunit